MSHRAVVFFSILLCLAGAAQGQTIEESLSVAAVERVVKGKDRPAIIIETKREISRLVVNLTRNDGKVFKFTGSKIGAYTSKTFQWDQPEGVYDYKGMVEAVFGDGETGTMAVSLHIITVIPLVVKVEKDGVDLKSRTFRLVMSRPAGKVEYNVYDDTGNAIDSGVKKFSGEPGGTPLLASWNQPEGATILKIEIKAYDSNDFFTGMELSPWWVAIPHDEVVFDFGKADVRKTEEPKLDDSYKNIEEVAAKYGSLVEAKLYIAGYTDTVDTAEYNQKLSEDRARSIAQFFRRKGFTFPIFYQGFGENVLAVPTPDNTPEEKNRRAVYVIAGDEPPPSGAIPRNNWKPLR